MVTAKTLAITFALMTLTSMTHTRLPFSPPSDGSLIVVPDNFPSIQAAINSAESGQKILVRNGTYNECIVINKPLTIFGEEGATLVGGETHTVEIRASNVCFCGFVLQGNVNKPWSGLYIYYSSRCVFENNTITGHYYGIQIYDSSQITLSNNELFGNRYNLEVWGLLPSHFMHQIGSDNFVDQKKVYYLVGETAQSVPLDAGYVALVNCSRIAVEDLILTNNGAGVLVAYSSGCIIVNVTAKGNIRGMRVLSSQDNVVINSDFSENGAGVAIEASKNTSIRNCLISKNVIGIFLSKSSILNVASEENIIFNNNISQNSYGLWLYFSDENVFQGNKIVNNLYGILLEASRNNLFYHNSIKNDEVQVEIKDFFSKNRWDAGYLSGGNFWGDYEGIDLKFGVFQNESGADGIGDGKYVIDKNNCDNYPLMGNVSNYEIGLGIEALPMIIIANSSVANFSCDCMRRIIGFDVVGPDGTHGFCRLVMPKTLITGFFGNRCIILMDGKEFVGVNSWVDNDFLYIYLVYTHPFHRVEIVSELPPTPSPLVPLFFYSALAFLFLFSAFLFVRRLKLRKLKRKDCSNV